MCAEGRVFADVLWNWGLRRMWGCLHLSCRAGVCMCLRAVSYCPQVCRIPRRGGGGELEGCGEC
jgi:hypothetical protein